jgi:hypothetical protein
MQLADLYLTFDGTGTQKHRQADHHNDFPRNPLI